MVPLFLTEFLWKLSHQRLATRSNLTWLTTLLCPICSQVDETTSHLFQTCRCTRLIWKRLNSFAAHSSFLDGPFSTWLQTNVANKSAMLPHGVPWYLIFVFVLWNIWIHRNNKVFKPKVWNVSQLIRCSYMQALTYKMLGGTSQAIHGKDYIIKGEMVASAEWSDKN